MRRAAFLGVAVLACLGGSTAIQVTQADRFVVLNANGKPAVVLASNKFGAGQLVVYDAIGKEAFAVRDGKVESRVLERWIRDQIQSALSQQAQPVPTTPTAPPSPRASGKRNLTVEQPAIYGADPVFDVRIEHAVKKSSGGEGSWRVVLALTNLSDNHIKGARFEVFPTARRQQFTLKDLGPKATDWVVLNLRNVSHLDEIELLAALSIEIVDIY